MTSAFVLPLRVIKIKGVCDGLAKMARTSLVMHFLFSLPVLASVNPWLPFMSMMLDMVRQVCLCPFVFFTNRNDLSLYSPLGNSGWLGAIEDYVAIASFSSNLQQCLIGIKMDAAWNKFVALKSMCD